MQVRLVLGVVVGLTGGVGSVAANEAGRLSLHAAAQPGPADGAPGAVVTPPLASGRTLAEPAQITAGDVKARVLLLRENLALLRAFMGTPEPAPPLFVGKDATMREAFFGALSAKLKMRQLAFEQLRTERPWRRPQLPDGQIAAADVLRQVDRALAIVLQVKRTLSIAAEPAERAQTDAADATELFNLLLAVSGEIDGLLDERMRSANAYVVVTLLIYQSMRLHLSKTSKMMPDEPRFEPNKSSDDVLLELMTCFQLIGQIAKTANVEFLALERVADVQRVATPNDIVDLSVLMMAELDELIASLGLKRDYLTELAPSRKFPAHVLQRARLLRRILTDVLAAKKKAGR